MSSCDEFLAVLTVYQSDNNLEKLRYGVIRSKDSFHVLILSSKTDKYTVYLLLMTHVADTLLSLQHVLSPTFA